MPRPKLRLGKKKRNKTSKQIWKNKRDLKKIKRGISYKWYDANCALTTVPNTGDQVCLNPINCGTGYNNRKDRNIQARRIMIRGYINNNNGTPADGVIRIILVRYKECNGASLTMGTLLYNHGTAAFTVNSNKNMDHKQDFDIICDTTFGYDTTQHTQIPFKIVKKFDHEVVYNSDSTSGIDHTHIEENSLWFMAITNQATEANAPSITAEYRYSFCDL